MLFNISLMIQIKYYYQKITQKVTNQTKILILANIINVIKNLKNQKN